MANNSSDPGEMGEVVMRRGGGGDGWGRIVVEEEATGMWQQLVDERAELVQM